MTESEAMRKAGRRRIISLAIQWGQQEPQIINPFDLMLVKNAGRYGLPSMQRGDFGKTWAARVRAAIKEEREHAG